MFYNFRNFTTFCCQSFADDTFEVIGYVEDVIETDKEGQLTELEDEI